MATKNDYYDRIISFLQSEITELKAAVSDLQKEMEEMRVALKQAGEMNTSAKEMPVEIRPSGHSLKTLPRKEVEILLSKVKTVCDEAITANHENYIEMFAMRSELDRFRDHVEIGFISAEKFRDYQTAQEIMLQSVEEKIGRRLSFVTINRHYHKEDKIRIRRCSFDGVLCWLNRLNLRWQLSVLVFIFILFFVVYLFSSMGRYY